MYVLLVKKEKFASEPSVMVCSRKTGLVRNPELMFSAHVNVPVLTTALLILMANTQSIVFSLLGTCTCALFLFFFCVEIYMYEPSVQFLSPVLYQYCLVFMLSPCKSIVELYCYTLSSHLLCNKLTYMFHF